LSAEEATDAAPKSTFVTVVAWLFIVISGCATPISVLQNVMLGIMSNHPVASDGGALAQMPAALRFLATHIEWFFRGFLVVCVYTLVVSIGLLQRKNWARLGFIGLLGAGILYQVVGVVFQSIFLTGVEGRGASADPQFAMFALLFQVFGVAMALAFVCLFGWMIKKLVSPGIRAEFGA